MTDTEAFAMIWLLLMVVAALCGLLYFVAVKVGILGVLGFFVLAVTVWAWDRVHKL